MITRLPERWQYRLLLWPLPILLLLCYVVPFAGIVTWSVTLPELGVDNYARLANDPSIHAVLWRTLHLCAIVGGCALLLAFLMAYCWLYSSSRWQRWVELCIFLPFFISVLVRTFGWLVALRNNGLVNSWLQDLGLIDSPLALTRNTLGVIIAMVHFMVPFAFFPLLSSMRQIDDRVLLAARGLGASRLRVFISVFLPQTLPGLLGAFIMVFVFCLGFFIIPAILGGGSTLMAAEYVFLQMFQTYNWGIGAALCVLMLVLVSGLVWLLMRFSRVERLVG